MIEKRQSVLIRPGLWDRIGLLLSGLCVLHCLLIPIALSILPLWSTAFEADAWVHPLFAFLLLPTTLMAMRTAGRRPNGRRVRIYFGLGLFLIFAAWILHDHIGTTGDVAITLIGSVLLITGHLHNWRTRTYC